MAQSLRNAKGKKMQLLCTSGTGRNLVHNRISPCGPRHCTRPRSQPIPVGDQIGRPKGRCHIDILISCYHLSAFRLEGVPSCLLPQLRYHSLHCNQRLAHKATDKATWPKKKRPNLARYRWSCFVPLLGDSDYAGLGLIKRIIVIQWIHSASSELVST